MGTYNIHSYNNAQDNDEPKVVVVLSDDDTEIVSITSSDPERQAEADEVIRGYVELGATPAQAMYRYAGSYGQVWNADGSGQVEEPEAEPEAAAEPETEEDEVVVSAAEDAPTNAVPGPASQIMSGATMAMVSDAGTVVTLFRADEEGNFFVRHDGNWQPLADTDVLADLAFVGVQESAVDLYDERLASGNLAPIKYYPPSPEGPYWPELVDDVSDESVEAPEDEEEPVTASIVVNSASDLDIAIAAALHNPDLRWFVERRIAALGLKASLPWQKG